MGGIRQIGNYIRRQGGAKKIPELLRGVSLAALLQKKIVRNYRYFIYKRRGGRSFLRRTLWYMKSKLFYRFRKEFLQQSSVVNNAIHLRRLQKALIYVKLFTYWTFSTSFRQYQILGQWARKKWGLRQFYFQTSLCKIKRKKSRKSRQLKFRINKGVLKHLYHLPRLRNLDYFSLAALRSVKRKGKFFHAFQNYCVFWRLFNKKAIKKRVINSFFFTKKCYRSFPYKTPYLKFMTFLPQSQNFLEYINFLLRRYLFLKKFLRKRYRFYKHLNKILYRFLQSLTNKVSSLLIRKFLCFDEILMTNYVLNSMFIPVTLLLLFNNISFKGIRKNFKSTELFGSFYDRQLSLNYNYPYKFRNLYAYHKYEYYQNFFKKYKKKYNFQKFKNLRWVFTFFFQLKSFGRLKLRRWEVFTRNFWKFLEVVFLVKKRDFNRDHFKGFFLVGGSFIEKILSYFLQRLLFVVYLLHIYPLITYNKIIKFLNEGFFRKNGKSCFLKTTLILTSDLLEYSYNGLLLYTGIYYWYANRFRKNRFFIKSQFLKFYNFNLNYWNSFVGKVTGTTFFLTMNKDFYYRYLYFFQNREFSLGIKENNWVIFNFAILAGVFFFTTDFVLFSISRLFTTKYIKAIFFALAL